MQHDRLEKLANNADNVKSGQNSRRVARIREYDTHIAAVRELRDTSQGALDLIRQSNIPASIIRSRLIETCHEMIERCEKELDHLEYQRNNIARAVQR